MVSTTELVQDARSNPERVPFESTDSFPSSCQTAPTTTQAKNSSTTDANTTGGATGAGGASAGGQERAGHYNRITKEWETPTEEDRYVVSSVQDGSTCPEEVGEPVVKTSFMDNLRNKFSGGSKNV